MQRVGEPDIPRRSAIEEVRKIIPLLSFQLALRTRIVADRDDTVAETSQLIIIGGGITGLNALTVASRYLSARARVILVDSRPRAGGMWVDTYDFVRLHQPYPIFTSGNIAGQLGKPADHLATRDEVLDHLRYCVDVARTKVDLEERFAGSTSSTPRRAAP